MLAPMITATDWGRVISPAVTNPTTRTVVTEEELSTPVTKAPVAAPMKRLTVSFSSAVRSAPPATFLSPSERSSSPARKSASPPKSPMPSCNQSTAGPAPGGVIPQAAAAATQQAMASTAMTEGFERRFRLASGGFFMGSRPVEGYPNLPQSGPACTAAGPFTWTTKTRPRQAA